MAHSILVIHGPNLQLLGEREVDVYGKVTLDQINADLIKLASTLDVKIVIHQCNHEGDIVDLVGHARKNFQGVLINPAAYTHTSVALRRPVMRTQLRHPESQHLCEYTRLG